MVSVRFSLSCLLIALLLTVCHAIARPRQGQGESRRMEQISHGEEGIMPNQGSPETTGHGRYKDQRGRKLMENCNNRTEGKEAELKAARDSNGEIERKVSNSASIRILNGMNGDGLESKNNKRSKSWKKHHHFMKKKKQHSRQRFKTLLPEKLDSTDSSSNGFVAFTADYGPPRHHPPKNN